MTDTLEDTVVVQGRTWRFFGQKGNRVVNQEPTPHESNPMVYQWTFTVFAPDGRRSTTRLLHSDREPYLRLPGKVWAKVAAHNVKWED
jgi:hypothetical protein